MCPVFVGLGSQPTKQAPLLEQKLDILHDNEMLYSNLKMEHCNTLREQRYEDAADGLKVDAQNS